MQIRTVKFWLDITASVACIIVCGGLLTGAVARYVRARNAPPSTQNNPVKAGLKRGDPFPAVPGFNYAQHRKSILFFLDAGCSHCVQSMPTYQRLFKRASVKPDSKVALLGLFETQSSRDHFVSLGFSIPATAKLPFGRYRVNATPTVLVIDASGNVDDFWVGELSAIAEQSLVHLLDSNS
jgi:hypothetical protein